MDKFVIKKRAAGSSGAASSSASSSATPRAAAAIRTAPCPICAATVDVGLMGHHIDSNCVEFCGPAKKKARASSSPDAPVVYTIGHATFDAAAVFGALRRAGVGTLVDVRSLPNSVTVTDGVDNSHWRRSALEKAAPLAYEWRGDALGGRGGRDAAAEAAALDDVASRAARREALCLMCCEKRYTNCHREGLATALVARGVRVVHLRADGEAEAHPRPLAALRAARHEALAGQYTVANFLSEAEEASLLAFLDGEPGHPFVRRDFNGPARGKAWGVRTDLKQRTFAEPARAMPDIFAPLVRRMRTIPELRSFRPNEANALDYRRSEGHYLGAHCDDRQLSGPILVNLCLAGDATMTYTRDRAGRGSAGETVRARLSRRALQIQSGSVRFDYRHGIANADFHADRRVSITFRMNKHPGHRV